MFAVSVGNSPDFYEFSNAIEISSQCVWKITRLLRIIKCDHNLLTRISNSRLLLDYYGFSNTEPLFFWCVWELTKLLQIIDRNHYGLSTWIPDSSLPFALYFTICSCNCVSITWEHSAIVTRLCLDSYDLMSVWLWRSPCLLLFTFCFLDFWIPMTSCLCDCKGQRPYYSLHPAYMPVIGRERAQGGDHRESSH